jgi:hypothetical protein
LKQISHVIQLSWLIILVKELIASSRIDHSIALEPLGKGHCSLSDMGAYVFALLAGAHGGDLWWISNKQETHC